MALNPTETNKVPVTADLFTFAGEAAGVKTTSFTDFVTTCRQLDHLDPALPVLTATTTLNDILGPGNPGLIKQKLEYALQGKMPNLQITKANVEVAITILEQLNIEAPTNRRVADELVRMRRQAKSLFPKFP